MLPSHFSVGHMMAPTGTLGHLAHVSLQWQKHSKITYSTDTIHNTAPSAAETFLHFASHGTARHATGLDG